MRERRSFLILVSIMFTIILGGCAANIQNVPIKSQAPDEPNVPDAIPVDAFEYNTTNSSYLPEYDINNTPISVWIIKEGDINVGFIVAGHARKAVCQVASIEVMTLFAEIGENTDSFFSFGIGFDLRSPSNEKWSPAYGEKIRQLEKKLGELSKRNPNEVIIHTIDFNTYKQAINTIEKHVKAADGSTWDTHVVEYKYIDSPLIVPFRDLETKEIVKIRISESYFGILPTQTVSRAINKILDDAEAEIKDMIRQNNETLETLAIKQTKTHDYYAWTVETNIYVYRCYRINGYPPAPTGFKIKKINALTGMVIETRDITAEEARTMLNNPSVTVEPNARLDLENWIPECDEHDDYVKKEKSKIKTIIANTRRALNRERVNIAGLRKKVRNPKGESELLIDAFLRGWPISTGNSILNTQLLKWYEEKRDYIWELILDHLPKLRVNDKLAGIFHSDDVFFKVTKIGRDFEITPYKVIGGDFVQVIDKKVGITQYFTPYNFR